jgi:hypothetical protein
LRKEGERLQTYYQKKVDSGYDVNKATSEMNMAYGNYQANVYSKLGYQGQSTYQGTVLEREELEPLKTYQIKKEEEKPKSIFFKVKIPLWENSTSPLRSPTLKNIPLSSFLTTLSVITFNPSLYDFSINGLTKVLYLFNSFSL